MAAGHLRVLLSQALDIQAAVVMLLASVLSDAERSVLLLNWSSGRAFVFYVLELKFGFWECLPHSVLVLGHHCWTVAREKLQRGYSQYQLTESEEHHYYVKLLFSKSSPLLRDVLSFLRGGHLTSALKRLASKFMMAPIVERSIERGHRYLTLFTRRSPHHSAAFLSSFLRLPEIKWLLDHDHFFCATWRSIAISAHTHSDAASFYR